MEFNILNKTICICGKRHSGKSELIKYILNLYGHQFNKNFVICPSEAVNHFYQKFYQLKTYLMNILMIGLIS